MYLYNIHTYICIYICTYGAAGSRKSSFVIAIYIHTYTYTHIYTCTHIQVRGWGHPMAQQGRSTVIAPGKWVVVSPTALWPLAVLPSAPPPGVMSA